MRWRSTLLTLLVVGVAAGAAAQSSDAPRLVHREPGMFGEVLVVDEGPLRYLRFGAVHSDDQSVIDLRNERTVPMDYIRYAAIGLAYAGPTRRVLMVGLGGGTFSAMIRRHLPEAWIDVVEIDPVVVAVAKRYFGVREDPRYTIHLADGAAFVRAAKQGYDLVLLDAYSGDGIPEHLGRQEFFDAVSKLLSDEGVVIANLSVSDKDERSLRRTMQAVFPRLVCFQTVSESNLLLVARADGRMPTPEALKVRAAALGKELGLPFDLAAVASRLGTGCP